MTRTIRVYCPVNGWDCPYWRENGACALDDPFKDCDDFGMFFDSLEDGLSDEDREEFE